jgi:hypothetical protein
VSDKSELILRYFVVLSLVPLVPLLLGRVLSLLLPLVPLLGRVLSLLLPVPLLLPLLPEPAPLDELLPVPPAPEE